MPRVAREGQGWPFCQPSAKARSTGSKRQAENLLALALEGVQRLAADKGYDSDALIGTLQSQAIEAVIPSRSCRKQSRTCDWFIDKERHLIECFFNKIKHYRRIFSRFEKLARNYSGFLHFVSALIWLW